MEIINVKVIEDDFIPAFEELMYKQMPAKQCLELCTCLDELVAQANVLRRSKKTIILKHAVTDGKPENVKSDANGSVIFPSPESELAAKTEIAEILMESIDIPLTERIKIFDDDISTPRKMRLLSDVIEIVERPIPEKEKLPVVEEKA